MTHHKNHHRRHYPHSRTSILLMLLGFYSITMLSIVESSSQSFKSVGAESESLSISGESLISSEESSSKEGGPLLKFLLRPVNSDGPLEQQNTDNNAAIHKGGELYLQHKDNDDSNVSSELDSQEVHRFRRDAVKIPSSPSAAVAAGGSKVIATNWGTYEEQVPVVVPSESRTIDIAARTDDDDDDSPTFSDEFQSREREDSGEYGQGSISYEEYEDGRFEGRQFYPSRSGAGEGGEEHEQPDGYYRQKYYATTEKPQNQQPDDLLRGEEVQKEPGNRPSQPNRNGSQRPKHRQPQREEPEESSGGGIMGFVQKAKTFYDIFRAMNSAWKTVEDHYRKNGQGIFPEDLKKMNESTRIGLVNPHANQLVKNNKAPNTKRPRTTKAPIIPVEEDEEQQQSKQQQQDTTQEKDEYRSRRSSVNVNDKDTTAHVTTLPETESSPSTEDSPNSVSDLESSASDSLSDTAVAEGRYIKGDPLKGYYDFVITEGSYKFWAVFQVGTAILIIYSTFAAIYYSKVNPLVSDYDYIDYLGGGRSLSDDSDFVDTDAPTGGADASKTGTPAGAASKGRQQQQQSSAGWFGWLPHAGHTLRFILESIDKGYNEEDKK